MIKINQGISRTIGLLLLYGTILFGLYLTSLYSYLLFHSLVELVSVVIGGSIFILVWNSQQRLDNNYLLFLGIAYLFVSLLDLIHTLAYKGVGVFVGYDANLPTELWIAARYLQSLSLLLCPLFLRRKLNSQVVSLGYLIITALLLAAIFTGVFPDCYIEGTGLTPFKIYSEYIISLILLVSIILLLRNKVFFDREALRWIILSLVFTIGSELAFTSYISVYGLANMLGHFFKLIAFYFIYLAIVEMGLERPHRLLFRDLQQSEAALRVSLEKYRVLFDNLPLGVTLTDKEGNILEANHESDRLLGIPSSKQIGRKYDSPEWRIIRLDGTPMPSSDFASVRAMYENRLIENVEMGIVKERGEITWLSVTAAPIPLEGYGVAIAYGDISVRKQIEAALRDSELRYRTITENMSDTVWLMDMSLKTTWISPSVTRTRGYTLEELQALPLDQQLTPDSLQRIQILMINELTPEKLADRHSLISADAELEFFRKDGSKFWGEVTVTILRDSEGRPSGFLGVGRDISERKQAESALRQSEYQYRMLMESLHEGIFTLDRQGVYRFINTFGAHSLGGTPEQIIGRHMQEYFPPPVVEYQMGLIEQVHQTRQPVTVESQSYIQGQSRWFHTHLQPLFLENDEIGSVLCIATDITERKNAEQKISASLAEKEVLLKEIHHRVKNNLAIMSSLLELQSRRSTSEQVRNEFQISQQRILAMAQIHEQLYRSPSLAEINMADYVGALSRNMLAMDVLSDVDIRLDIQGVYLDIDQAVPCGLIINELLTNAVKYAFQVDELPLMRQKEIHVAMRDENGRICMNIGDNGVGLPEGLDVRKTRTLGFTLVHRLTSQLAGDIQISSRPGGGSIFTISFPLSARP